MTLTKEKLFNTIVLMYFLTVICGYFMSEGFVSLNSMKNLGLSEGARGAVGYFFSLFIISTGGFLSSIISSLEYYIKLRSDSDIKKLHYLLIEVAFMSTNFFISVISIILIFYYGMTI